MQDKEPKGRSSVQVRNSRIIVTEWRFQPGEATGYHRHHYDYLVVPLHSGKLKITGPDGAVSYSQLAQGQSYFRNAGVEHNVLNANDYEFAFVEIEFIEDLDG